MRATSSQVLLTADDVQDSIVLATRSSMQLYSSFYPWDLTAEELVTGQVVVQDVLSRADGSGRAQGARAYG